MHRGGHIVLGPQNVDGYFYVIFKINLRMWNFCPRLTLIETPYCYLPCIQNQSIARVLGLRLTCSTRLLAQGAFRISPQMTPRTLSPRQAMIVDRNCAARVFPFHLMNLGLTLAALCLEVSFALENESEAQHI